MVARRGGDYPASDNGTGGEAGACQDQHPPRDCPTHRLWRAGNKHTAAAQQCTDKSMNRTDFLQKLAAKTRFVSFLDPWMHAKEVLIRRSAVQQASTGLYAATVMLRCSSSSSCTWKPWTCLRCAGC